MFKNYFKIAWRNLLKNKTSSFINISGLAVGMAVAMLIGLWIWDELSFNKNFKNYDRIAQVMQNQTYNNVAGTQTYNPIPLGNALRTTYGSDFKHVLMATGIFPMVLNSDEKVFTKKGAFFEPGVTDMLSLNMLWGTRGGLKESASIILSQSVAKAFFGNADPMGKVIKIDTRGDAKVTGVYEDLPVNSEFNDMSFIASWQLMLAMSPVKTDDWNANSFQTYIQLADNANMDKVSAKIKNIKLDNVDKETAKSKPEMFLQPMSNWHLYSQFENGKNVGGRIKFVWLFGIIGVFILLLACINFMNLATARSEKRSKEVGIRKAIGSLRSQLIKQFFSESLLITVFAFVLSILSVLLTLPSFNGVAGKQMNIPWTNPVFWFLGIVFCLVTGLIAGSYPAIYLSSFQPIKVLKGTFKMGRFALIPRKVSVVFQFTVSIALIIGVIIVYKEIQFAKNRPTGYNSDGLVVIRTPTDDVHTHFDALRSDLKNSGAITEIAESHSSPTEVELGLDGFDWKGKDPNLQTVFATIMVSYEFGKTVDWQFVSGRDFSVSYSTDSSAIVLNETAVKFMGLKNPVGEPVYLNVGGNKLSFKVIGVIKDMLMESPYQPVQASVFFLNKDKPNFVTIKINPAVSAATALVKIEAAFKKYNPAAPFEYKFVSDEYAAKFNDEERIGKLANFFAILAIFISCLGIFGLASFVAEQRTKEIGVRKVLGASVMNVCTLLSKDFIRLVFIAFIIAAPIAYYFMNNWLQNYEYRTGIDWWVFAVTFLGAMLITLLTVSFQAIKAAIANPVKSLRTE